jgi:hypothetical protein
MLLVAQHSAQPSALISPIKIFPFLIFLGELRLVAAEKGEV